MKKLNELRSEIDKCVRCGTCRSSCPTFKAIGRETSCARGRVTLVAEYLNGGVGLTDLYLKHLKECTLCGACRTNCPNGVDTVAIFAAARRDATEKLGVPFAASVVFKNLMASGGILSLGLKLATRLQGLFFKDASAGLGLLSRFSLPLVGGGRLVPPLAPVQFLDLPEVKAEGRAKETGRPKVAFYSGCGVNYLMPDVGLKSLAAIRKAGADVFVPQGQVCCGMPAYAMGDIQTARGMALKNLELLEGVDAEFIVTSCATCGHGLKHLMTDLFEDTPEVRARAEKVSSKVRDISELLIKELGYKAKGSSGASKRVVTYHDPCHLGRAQGLREEPRDLLKMGSGVVLKELKNPCLCCGLGGGLMYNNYGLSMEIAAKKAENIKNSGAEVVATACPGCIVQLRDGLHRFGVKDVKVAHVVELLSEEE